MSDEDLATAVSSRKVMYVSVPNEAYAFQLIGFGPIGIRGYRLEILSQYPGSPEYTRHERQTLVPWSQIKLIEFTKDEAP